MFGIPLFPAVLLLAGVFDLLVALGIYLFLDRFRRKTDLIRRKWRPVPVKILSSRLVETAGENAPLFTAEVRYEYTVDGTRYECDRISIYPRWSSSDSGSHRKVVEDFPTGEERTGWVNPWNPKEAVLVTDALPPQGLRIVLLILAGTGVATLIAAAAVWLTGTGSPS